MRIGFITPSFHTLGPTWRRDPQVVKLAAPQICGSLFAHGYRDIRQYDFEIQIFALEYESPGRLNLQRFFDDTAVERFLASDDGVLRDQANLILDMLAIEEADLFAFSCASVLEIYADMHAVASLNICLATALKERFPSCKTVVGGLKISPDTKHRAEYISMLERCSALDFAAEGSGEVPLLNILTHLETGKSFEALGQDTQRHGNGWLLYPRNILELRVLPDLAREMGMETDKGFVTVQGVSDEVPVYKSVAKSGEAGPLSVQLSSTTAQVLGALAESKRLKEEVARLSDAQEFGPQGDHERRALYNPSIFVTPWYDKQNTEQRKLSGRELLQRYHLHGEWEQRLGPYQDDRVAILPMIFMEGCNARCAFCAYSMTKMLKRDVEDVVRAIAWMREEYDIRYFHFLNTNINGSMQYAEAFCDALIGAKLDVFWSDCANLWALNERVLEKMRRSGAVRFTYGVECPSDRMLDYIGKGITVKQAHQRLKQASALGIWNHLLLITGLPTETEEDTKHFIDFLEQSAEYANAYSISSFYLISSSLMGAFPQRYGLEMLSNPSGLLEDQAFNEIGGLPWAQKKRQIIRSTEIITDAIKRIKQDPKYWSGAIDLELLFWLYDRLGPDNKRDIVRCYEDAFLGSPAHPKSYAPAMRALLENGDGVTPLLTQAGMRARPDDIRIAQDTLYLPIETPAQRIELEFRVLGQGASPNFTSGRNLGTSVTLDTGFADALAKLIAPGAELVRAITQEGWRIVRDRGRSNRGDGFRLELGERAIDVTIMPMAADEAAFVKHQGLGFIYSVPHDRKDPTKVPRVMAFLQRIAKYLLYRLAKDPSAARAGVIDTQALRQFAAGAVEALEAAYATELDGEPLHQMANLGRRHGDKFSKVDIKPPKVALNTTTYCNEKCKFCIVYDKLNRPELNMTDEQVYDVLRQSRADGATEVGYSGGEPSIDPRIITFIRFAKELGYTHQSMNTNGLRFKQKKFCEEIIDAGLTNVDISIHGHTDELHDGLVVKRGALAAVRQACANLNELRQTRGFDLSATIVVARDNHAHLRDICVFVDSLGVTFKRMKYAYEGNMTLDMIVDQVAPYEDVVPSIKDALDYLATQPHGFTISQFPTCLLGEHAAFAQNYERGSAVMMFKDHKVYGDPTHYFRKDGDECSRCVLHNLCPRLDSGYEQFHGRPPLVPFTSHDEVETMFASALARFPAAAKHVRHNLQLYRQNRGMEPPTKQRVGL